MRYKRLLAFIIAGTIIAASGLTGCGNKNSGQAAATSAQAGSAAAVSETAAPLKDIADRLHDEIKYDDELSLMDDDLFSAMYPDIPESDVSDKVIYLSSGSTAEEIACFEAKDAAAADEIEKGLKARVDSQKTSFTDYVPAEVDRLDKAVIVKKGTRVYLSVSGDPDKAKEILQ